jgi:hypothetical protein
LVGDVAAAKLALVDMDMEFRADHGARVGFAVREERSGLAEKKGFRGEIDPGELLEQTLFFDHLCF